MINVEEDKWRAMSRRLGTKMERPSTVVRFSRKLLIAGALFLILVGLFNLI